MRIDAAGYLDGTRSILSPNCDERPAGCAISLLVIHNISLPPEEFGGDGVIELFTNRIDPGAHPYYQALRGLKAFYRSPIRGSGSAHPNASKQISHYRYCRAFGYRAGPEDGSGPLLRLGALPRRAAWRGQQVIGMKRGFFPWVPGYRSGSRSCPVWRLGFPSNNLHSSP